MSTAPQTGPVLEAGVDVRYYADVLWRGRLVIATAALVGAGLGVLVGYLQTPEYRAGTMIQIEPPSPTFMTVTDALMGGGNYWQNTDFYNTQFRILRSKSLGEKVVEQLQQLNPGDQPAGKDAAQAASALMAHVTVEPVPESRLVMLWVTHQDPRLAAQWANTLAEVYIHQTLTTRVESAKNALEWLQKQLASTQQSMREAQEKLLKALQGQDLFVPEGSVSAVTTSIGKLNADYIDAQARRIVLEAARNQIAEMRRRGQSLESVPQVAADPQLVGFNGQLASLSVELSRLREKYKEAHPEVQKVQAQIDQVRKGRDARAAQIVEGLDTEYNQLQRREAELKTAIESQKAQAATQSRKVTELEALKKETESAKGLYEVLLQKLNETNIAASVRGNTASIVERASPPTSPVRPEKKKLAALALLIGLVAGSGLVLARDYFDNTIKSPEEIERYLHLDLLAAVPKYDEANVHLVTEAYQNLRTALIFGRKDEAGQVVLITGTAPQEGKTTTLVNIAKLLASSGEKTVVLDLDLRRSQLHNRLGLPREPGLTDFFVKHEDLDALIQPTRVPNLFALTAGPLPPNPPALLARKNVTAFLDHLRRHFEWILMDSPPLASVTDALLLARHADMTVVVVQHNKVDKKLIKRSVAALRKVAPGSLLGAVLNAVDVKAQGYYYYYYHHDQPGSGAGERKPGPHPVAAAKT